MKIYLFIFNLNVYLSIKLRSKFPTHQYYFGSTNVSIPTCYIFKIKKKYHSKKNIN